MAKGFKHGGGGGAAASLNFKVVGGTSRPSSPGENTVWVNTDTAVSSWVLSPVEPEAAEGLVWISMGFASAAAFNALKKNGIMIYPIAAKQYVDGAWANKAAEIYREEAWVSFSTEALYLYQPGDQDSFTTQAISETGAAQSVAPTVTYGSESVVILPARSTSSTAYRGGVVRTVDKIDLSSYSTLTLEGTIEGIGTGTGKLSIWSEMGSAQNVNRVKYAALVNGSAPITIDVSDLEGSYYIGLGFDSTNVQIMVTMTALRLE